ncbi:50S ribosomal protein L17 [bacterium]|nr:50S ribosomal protein L17 [bacterium]|tara:strand:+ start:350 stop:700 length:351 start_codon:yes stop_codon:yes gene_type:complete
MRHRKSGKTFGRKAAPRKALLRNLATSIIIHEKVKTTAAKAKAVKPVVEKLITISKKNDLNSRRKLQAVLFHDKAIAKSLEVIGPRYQKRSGGYTRITRLGQRQGDGAEVVQIELV